VPIQAAAGFMAGGFGIAHTNRLLEAMPTGDSGAAMSAHLALQGLAGITSSLAGGYLFDRQGLLGPALAAGLCLWVAAGLFAGLRPKAMAGPVAPGTEAS
jgi:hypothetical protein